MTRTNFLFFNFFYPDLFFNYLYVSCVSDSPDDSLSYDMLYFYKLLEVPHFAWMFYFPILYMKLTDLSSCKYLEVELWSKLLHNKVKIEAH